MPSVKFELLHLFAQFCAVVYSCIHIYLGERGKSESVREKEIECTNFAAINIAKYIIAQYITAIVNRKPRSLFLLLLKDLWLFNITV